MVDVIHVHNTFKKNGYFFLGGHKNYRFLECARSHFGDNNLAHLLAALNNWTILLFADKSLKVIVRWLVVDSHEHLEHLPSEERTRSKTRGRT